MLDAAADLVDGGGAELDDVERVQHGRGVFELVVDRGLVAGERVKSCDLHVLPERFAALVPSSTTPPSGPLITNMNLWVFACSGDAGVPIQSVRHKVEQINKAGGSALLTELPTNSHDSWTEALKNQRVHAWMIQQKRNSYFNSPPGVYLAPRTWPKTAKEFGPQIACIALLVLIRIGFRSRKETRNGT